MSRPEPPIPVHCPHCQGLVNLSPPCSGYSMHATLWTDGIVTDTVSDEYLDLMVCPHCEGLFWGSKAEENRHYAHLRNTSDFDPFSDDPMASFPEPEPKFVTAMRLWIELFESGSLSDDEMPPPPQRGPDFETAMALWRELYNFGGDYEMWVCQKLPFSKPLSEAVWLQAAQSLDNEFYSRRIAWQCANDAFRTSRRPVVYSAAQRQNMEKLAAHCESITSKSNQANPEESVSSQLKSRQTALLHQVEIWRNLGEFERASAVIEASPQPREPQLIYLGQLVKKKVRRTRAFATDSKAFSKRS